MGRLVGVSDYVVVPSLSVLVVAMSVVALAAQHFEVERARSEGPGIGAVRKPSDRPHPLELGETIDLRTADRPSLMRLPGVGPRLADRLVERRDLGALENVEDLDAVPGIGPRLLARLTPLVRFGPSEQPDEAHAHEEGHHDRVHARDPVER